MKIYNEVISISDSHGISKEKLEEWERKAILEVDGKDTCCCIADARSSLKNYPK